MYCRRRSHLKSLALSSTSATSENVAPWHSSRVPGNRLDLRPNHMTGPKMLFPMVYDKSADTHYASACIGWTRGYSTTAL